MYCKNCGVEMNSNAAVCLACGAAANSGSKYCNNCGAETAENAAVCTSCGAALNHTAADSSAKSKLVAGLLAIFLGSLGIHNFYLGYTKKAVIQLVVSLVGALLFGIGPIAMEVWAIIEAVQIFTGKMTDANGAALQD